MFDEIIKMLEQFDNVERMEAQFGEWHIEISPYGGKHSIEFTRPLKEEKEE